VKYTTEEPYLAVVRGGQVGWVELASGAPEVMTEVKFTVRAAQSLGAQRDISLCLNVPGLQVLVEKAQEALELAKQFEANPPPADSVNPPKETT
jgi:hypothetical protein